MANPNIVNATAIYAGSTGIRLLPTGTTAIISNASSSGKIFFVEALVVANTDTTNAVDVTVQAWNNATPGATGATGVAIASTITVPAKASLVVISKDMTQNVMENQSISVTPGTAAKLDVSCDYKEIS
jgi:hypothetical protein